jgi:hypothetical protein
VFRRVKKLEKKVDSIGKTVLDLFKKYDEHMKDVALI